MEMSFRLLTWEEEEEFRKWAWNNYEPFSDIKGIWHPTTQAECVKINSAKANWIEGAKRNIYG